MHTHQYIHTATLSLSLSLSLSLLLHLIHYIFVCFVLPPTPHAATGTQCEAVEMRDAGTRAIERQAGFPLHAFSLSLPLSLLLLSFRSCCCCCRPLCSLHSSLARFALLPSFRLPPMESCISFAALSLSLSPLDSSRPPLLLDTHVSLEWR